MKKIFIAFVFLLMFCSICFAEMTEIEQIYFKAKEPSNDPIVGIWKGFRKGSSNMLRKERIEMHFAILPTHEDSPEWEYKVVALEELALNKNPDHKATTVALLRKTENAHVYYAKMIHLWSDMPASLTPIVYNSNDEYLDFSSAANDFIKDIMISAIFSILIKNNDYVIPEFEEKYSKKDESWRKLLAPTD